MSAVGKIRYFPEESINGNRFYLRSNRVDELQQATIPRARIRNNGPDEQEVAKVSKQILTSHEEYQHDDVYWLSRFLELVRRGKSLPELVDTVDMVKKMDVSSLEKLFPTILELENSLELIQVPKED